MAGKTTATPAKAADAKERVKPGPKPGAKPGPKSAADKAAAKPGADASLGERVLGVRSRTAAEQPQAESTFTTFVEVAGVRKVFLENMAHALIFDIFQMQTVLHAIRDIDEVEVSYFLDFYASRLRPLLIEDGQNDDIGGLLDLGVWYALEGQEEILTEGLISRLGGNIQATPQQIKELAIEAVYGDHRNDSPSRGERWMPALHRNSSREDMQRVSPRHERDERNSRRAR
jgi:hypothetical protein